MKAETKYLREIKKNCCGRSISGTVYAQQRSGFYAESEAGLCGDNADCDRKLPRACVSGSRTVQQRSRVQGQRHGYPQGTRQNRPGSVLRAVSAHRSRSSAGKEVPRVPADCGGRHEGRAAFIAAISSLLNL